MPGIRRGDIYWLDLGRGTGSEQQGRRPVLVIQNDTGNQFSPNTIVAPFTTSVPEKTYPFQAKCSPAESGLGEPCLVDLATIVTVSKGRLRERCGHLGVKKMLQVDEAIKVSLGLS
jgi:mRNA interferase MazF